MNEYSNFLHLICKICGKNIQYENIMDHFRECATDCNTMHIHRELQIERERTRFLTEIITSIAGDNISKYATNNTPQPLPLNTPQPLPLNTPQPLLSELKHELKISIQNVGESRTSTTPIIKTITLLLGKIANITTFSEYIEIVNSVKKQFTDEITKRSFSKKRIDEMLITILSPLDLRLIGYPNYFCTHISPDDITRFKTLWKNSINYKHEYSTFNIDYSLLTNYSMALFSITECIEHVFINPNGYPNIIYNPSAKSNENDPHNFYVLGKITDKYRYWDLDNRCIKIANEFSVQVLPFAIHLFRKIYCDIFHDNIYRDNFELLSKLEELEQFTLLKNIYILGDVSRLRKIVCNCIRKNVIYTPSTLVDKFKLISDDPILKTRLSSEITGKSVFIDIIKQAFDEISSEQLETLYLKMN